MIAVLATLAAAEPASVAHAGVSFASVPWSALPWREGAMLGAPVVGTAAARLLGRRRR